MVINSNNKFFGLLFLVSGIVLFIFGISYFLLPLSLILAGLLLINQGLQMRKMPSIFILAKTWFYKFR